jgi:hypothetical protein
MTGMGKRAAASDRMTEGGYGPFLPVFTSGPNLPFAYSVGAAYSVGNRSKHLPRRSSRAQTVS